MSKKWIPLAATGWDPETKKYYTSQLYREERKKIKVGDIKYEILETLLVFPEVGKWHKELTFTRWSGKEPKYDLRPWNADRSECLKGITLTKEELVILKEKLGGIDL